MQVRTFTAATAAEALEQIRAALGPQAVVLHVRQASDAGLARLWTRPRIEVVAGVPASEPTEPASSALAEMQEEIREIRRALSQAPAVSSRAAVPVPGNGHAARACAGAPGWRAAGLLLEAGLHPVHVESLLERVQARHGGAPPPALADELCLVREVLAAAWPGAAAADAETGTTHVLVGPPGSGKSTLLCKWLARATLVDGRTAAVSRLDAHVPNLAESVSVYAEILGVPVTRGAAAPGSAAVDLHLVDVPGVAWSEAAALESHLETVRAVAPEAVRIHLVLNAAYDVRVLEAQVRAFMGLPIDSLMFTHTDEVRRWGGVWNVVLGTKHPVRWMSGGQNVPGDIACPSGRTMTERVIGLPATI